MRIRMTGLAILVVALGLAPAHAEPADCAALEALVESATGTAITAPPAGQDGDWCVLDHARLQASGTDQPDLKAETLRLMGVTEDGSLTRFALQVTGLRLGTGLGDNAGDAGLRQMLRLQSAELSLQLALTAGDDPQVAVNLDLAFSGGTALRLDLGLAATGLSPLELLAARVRTLHLVWSPDPRLLRQMMERAGSDATPAPEALGLVRDGVATGIAALPDSLLSGDARKALVDFAAALPEARGLLDLRFTSPEGIGLLDLALAGRSDPPFGPEALDHLFQGSTVTAGWSPGQAMPDKAPLE